MFIIDFMVGRDLFQEQRYLLMLLQLVQYKKVEEKRERGRRFYLPCQPLMIDDRGQGGQSFMAFTLLVEVKTFLQ